MEIALFLQGREANLLSRVLDEVKTTIFEKSETSLSDKEALEVLVSYFENAKKLERKKEASQISVNPLSKRLFLGHIIVEKAARTQRAPRGKAERYRFKAGDFTSVCLV